MEVSRLRVASLLRRSGRASGGAEIVATPSLVSLSGDFFVRDDRRGRRRPRSSSRGREASRTRTFSSSHPNSDDEGGGGGGGGDGIRGRTNDDDVAMGIRDTTTTADFQGASFDGSRRGETRTTTTLLPRSSIAGRRPVGYNRDDVDDGDHGYPPDDWPVGPQGAPVPSHLLLPRRDDGQWSSSPSRMTEPLTSSSAASFLFRDEDGYSHTPQVSSHSTAPQSRPRSPPPPFGALRHLRRRRNGGGEHGVYGGAIGIGIDGDGRRARGQEATACVDSVRSLIRAVRRLEDGYGPASTSSSSQWHHPPRRPPELDELESDALTRLVEIMLRPPTTLVVDEYDDGDRRICGYEWDDDGKDEVEDSDVVIREEDYRDCNEKGADGSSDDYDCDDGVHSDEGGQEMAGQGNNEGKRTMTIEELATVAVFAANARAKPKYPTVADARRAIDIFGKSVSPHDRRRVCQYAFRKNDIVWVCRTCQVDETCVLCHDCFSHSDHEGHDVAFYHAQAGGCCDCGDVDAWDPKGFCGRHGGPGASVVARRDADGDCGFGSRLSCAAGDGWGESNAATTKMGVVEPAVLGSVRAIADFLVMVVTSGVEEGYRRANPLMSSSKGTIGNIVNGHLVSQSADNVPANTSTCLPENYEGDLGRSDQRNRGSLRKSRCLEMETDDSSTNIIMTSEQLSHVAPVNITDDGDDPMKMMPMSHLSTPIIHEVQFNPSMASSSSAFKKNSHPSAKRDSSTSDCNHNVFDPMAAGLSSSMSSPWLFSESSSPFASTHLNHRRAAKKACRGGEVQDKTPARAVGDLGRKEHGLFLVLHCDAVHFGPSSSSSHHSEVITALKELYASSGGGGRAAGEGGNAAVGGGISGAAFLEAPGLNHLPVDLLGTSHFTQQHFVLAPPTRNSLFRAPHMESILERIVQIVKKQGDLIVWGTQEIITECGDVIARCWRDGDPHSSSLVGASLLNRAKILTDRGLVCTVKTRKELRDEQLATAVLHLMGWLALSCDQLCDQVSMGISGQWAVGVEGEGDEGGSALTPLLRNDLKLPYQFVTAWHTVLLTLLAVPNFKAAMSRAYCDTYRAVAVEYARGIGLIERSSFTLSVQFLNRVSYVTDLVRSRNLLNSLFRCLLDTIRSATFKPGSSRSRSSVGMDHLDVSLSTGSVLESVGFFTMDGGDNMGIARLDSETYEMYSDVVEGVSGSDLPQPGRSSDTRKTGSNSRNSNDAATHQYLSERMTTLIPPTLDPFHTVLSHRRYSVCISDLKCVLNVDGISRHFASYPIDQNYQYSPSSTSAQGGGADHLPKMQINDECTIDCALDDWIKTLALAQQMDGQIWRPSIKDHVETEAKGWVGAFNASISLSSLFERVLNWDDDDPSPIENCNVRLLSCVELTHRTLTVGVHHWQRSEMRAYRPTHPPNLQPKVPDYCLSPASLPFSTVATAHGSALAMVALPLPQIAAWSFHLPLHRFVAACIREVSRRLYISHRDGISKLLEMFALPIGNDASAQFRLNALLFRGLMEFPAIVLSRAAQIRAGVWRRNGPAMLDQVMNYSEPPFCRPLADADMLLLQFALICHTSQIAGKSLMSIDSGPIDRSATGLAFVGQGTLRLVNLLIHRFGVFDFLGFDKAPNTSVEKYREEIRMGLYPPEIHFKEKTDAESSAVLVLPWTFCPTPDDPVACLHLVEELMHLIIILITEMPSPTPNNKDDEILEAKRRLKREVIHRLASGNKCHSEMTEVSHVLSARENLVLGETFVNREDASCAALEDALGEVATRKQKSGAPDEWELQKDSWKVYDPAFHHISTRDHQVCAENRPKPSGSAPYAPRPAPAHVSFQRIRRDLTADACILAMTYRVLHAHCYRNDDDSSAVDSIAQFRGNQMYGSKSETLLARALHLLTLGAYAWDNDCSDDRIFTATSWKDLGGGDIGSVFHGKESAPNACDWVFMALLRDPSDVMDCECYRGKENTLTLLRQIGCDGGNHSAFLSGLDPALRSGASWLCDYAAKVNPIVAARSAGIESTVGGRTKEEEQEKKKIAAKDKAIAAMKAHMAKFAANILSSPGFEDDDRMSDDGDSCRSPSRRINEATILSTPVRHRSLPESEAVQAIDLSPGDFMFTSPITSPSTPFSPRTPHTPYSSCDSTPRTSHNAGIRLMNERPQCIVCGADDPMHIDDALRDQEDKMSANASSEEDACQQKNLAFCGYSQASTVIKGGDVVPSCGPCPKTAYQSHVGVHITLCGHAIHKGCCDAYLKTVVSQRDDMLEGGKRKEFRCPLCQRLSNCLVPFVDVAADWADIVTLTDEQALSPPTAFKREEEDETINFSSRRTNNSLHDFLSKSKWWATKNDLSVSWDGHCTFSPKIEKVKPLDFPILSPPRQPLKMMQAKFGKKELISAWNSILRTPRLVKRRTRSFSADASPTFGQESESRQSESNNSDVLRRFLDQVSDVAYRADMRRVGEEALFSEFGEFRHYLSEKAAYNKVNRAAGKEMVDWPMCLSPTSMTETRRQELSREKLISKVLFSIQAFVYTCCAEATEARRLLRDSPECEKPSILTKFGIEKVLLGGDLLLFPEANASVDECYQPFDGRLGKLRYLSLALMVATSPVSMEVTQLCMSFPGPEPDPFDFDMDENASIKRAPVAYPILNSHVLTHTTGALFAVTGRARAEEGKYRIESLVNDCRNFVQIGLIARVGQVLLARLRPKLCDDPIWEQHVCLCIEHNMMHHSGNIDADEHEWRHFCVKVLHILLSQAKTVLLQVPWKSPPHSCPNDADDLSFHILHAIESAKSEAISFLRDLSLICQILIPNVFCMSLANHIDVHNEDSAAMLRCYVSLFNLESQCKLLDCPLLQEIMESWYAHSSRKNTNQLEFLRVYRGPMDGPSDVPIKIPSSSLPLLGNCCFSDAKEIGSIPHVLHLPKSYTDLYVMLSELCPNMEQIALCLVCGQVLNAGGKGECTKHAYTCGAGAGIFFLVQECIGLIIHGHKAAYINSPYVDFYGETPQYRGRPLNLDLDRYRIMQGLYRGHLIREKVIAERTSTRQVIFPNFY